MIRICNDISQLSMAAAKIFADEAIRACQKHERFTVLLAGGDTPRRTYELLARDPFKSEIPWQNVHLFWGDERCVSSTDPRNNAMAARKALIDNVPIPRGHVHPIRTELPPSDGAVDYERQLKSFFLYEEPVFDLVILGLGEDGHTASLFPGTASYPENKLVVVTEKKGEEIKRISLTPKVFNLASKVIFLVSGKNKAAVLQEVLYGPADPVRLPAQLIKLLDDRLLWLVDEEASGVI